jgi:hypothetical protein
MVRYMLRGIGVALALFALSVSATSEARYSFGRLKAQAGGVIARDESQSCGPLAPDNIKVRIIETRNGVVTNDYPLWGLPAQNMAADLGLPIQVDDQGVNTCSQSSGTVWAKFRNGGQTFELTAYDTNFFSNTVWIGEDSRIGGDLSPGWVHLSKRMACSFHGEWNTSVGTGGGSYDGSTWSWEAHVTYFKSW